MLIVYQICTWLHSCIIDYFQKWSSYYTSGGSCPRLIKIAHKLHSLLKFLFLWAELKHLHDTGKGDSHYKHALKELKRHVHEDMAIVWFPWASQPTQNGILAELGTRLHHHPALFSKYPRRIIYILILRTLHSPYSSSIYYLIVTLYFGKFGRNL